MTYKLHDGHVALVDDNGAVWALGPETDDATGWLFIEGAWIRTGDGR